MVHARGHVFIFPEEEKLVVHRFQMLYCKSCCTVRDFLRLSPEAMDYVKVEITGAVVLC